MQMTYKEWYAEGRRRFGDDVMKWKFVCPACGHVASVQDYKDAGAPEEAVAFSCIGLYLPSAKQAFSEGPGPCTYAGGGLFRLNPVKIEGRENSVFAFADP